jgi:UPF0755 protein
MMDELDLGFEEYPERGRHRHRRSTRKPPKKRRRGRSFVALFFTLVLLGGLAAGGWYGYEKLQGFFNAPDFNSAGTGEVTVQVKKGDTATDIANTLVTKNVVKSARAFVEAADANPRSKNIQPGFYKLREQMRARDAVAMLLDLKNKIVTKVTIPEGRSAKATYDILSKATGIPAAEFANLAKDPVKLGIPELWFVRSDKKPVAKSIEGFLFPQTYEFDPGVTAEDIMRTMVNQFIQVAEEINFMDKVGELNITPYDALIVASLAQAEAGVPEDIGKIARVAYNRLYKNFDCKCLQMDVTVNYWFELNGKPTKTSGQMTQSDLHNPNNPWNTHDKQGLPPSPINNPGKVALEGAMAPPDGGWYYFVAIDKAGHSAFATTLAEH